MKLINIFVCISNKKIKVVFFLITVNRVVDLMDGVCTDVTNLQVPLLETLTKRGTYSQG